MIVAAVSNTFGESRPYLLSAANAVDGERLRSYTQAKELHVSPFMGMDQTYRFFFSEPDERLYARIDVEEGGERPFLATIVGRGEPLTTRSLLRTLARHPFMTGRITALIHWEALKLWLKGVPVVRKPPFDPQRGSVRP